jgi:hypothetical protein
MEALRNMRSNVLFSHRLKSSQIGTEMLGLTFSGDRFPRDAAQFLASRQTVSNPQPPHHVTTWAKSYDGGFSESGIFEGGPGCELGLALTGHLFPYTRRMLAPTAASFSSMRS